MDAKVKERTKPTNGAKTAIEFSLPYAVEIQIQGTADLMFHRWNCEAIAEAAGSVKGGKAKKFDDTESYLWRNEQGQVCLPGEYFRQSIIHAAKNRQDPRSPRKSAMDLFKAGVVCLTNLHPLADDPDYYDTRRVTIQRNGINRTRPCMKAGWEAEFILQVITPEYIDEQFLQDVVGMAGRLVGVGDFRPTFGRYNVTSFQRLPS